ncbi:ABC transporter permease [Actinoplanes sp. NPDC049265]|uniref:ABC transporter permease n=1 Tax=Actinoplanes sp. NPDC049265 TaxID=3363902 RepID=UPI0037148B39
MADAITAAGDVTPARAGGGMNALARTGALTRLALRLDRVRLTAWVLVVGAMPAATAANYQKLYPTEASLDVVRGVVGTPALVALNGPLFRVSIGSLTSWKIGVTAYLMAALMSIFTVVRHTRAEEETGRLELLGATVVGRNAPLTAALLTAGLANGGIALVTAAGLVAVGLPGTGSVALGLSIGLVGLVFAAVAAVTAQLGTGARTANGMAAAVLGVAYLLRALGDTGPAGLSWVSPIGWATRLRPYAGERWWVVALFAALLVALLTVAYRFVAARDQGTGVLPERPAPATAGASLSSPLGLAWRLHRGTLLGWMIGLAVAGAVMGGAVHGVSDAGDLSPQMTELLARMGGRKALADQFLAAVMGIAGLTAAAYTVQATMRLRAEESGGRTEPLLATPISRTRWATSHLVFAALGTALLLAVFGAAAGLVYGASTGDIAGQVARLTVAALVQLPAAWVVGAIGVALFGFSARLAAIAWAVLVTSVLIVELGAILGLNHWVMDTSPFTHVPKLPGTRLVGTPLVWLSGVAVVLATGGLAAFRRRDLR